MAKQVAKSGLMAKYGNKLSKAVSEHAADETTYGIQDLPGGIRNGVAQLCDCKFDVYKSGPNQGEYYFYAAGIVESPETVTTKDGVIPVKGLRTNLTIPVCDTTTRAGKVTTQEDHVANILNEMRKLGAETDGVTGDQLESLAASLLEAAPRFRFSTSQGDPTPEFPTPRTWHNWHGSKGLEDYIPDNNEGAVSDQTEGEEETSFDLNMLAELADDGSDSEESADAQRQINAAATEAGIDSNDYTTWAEVVDAINNAATDANQADAATGGDELDLDALGAAGDEGDEDAQAKLNELGAACDPTLDEGDYASWAEYAEAIKGAGGEYGTAEQSQEVTPAKGEVYLYKAKGAKKAVECEVMLVNAKAKTCTLKNLDDGKMVKDVKWAELSAE